eukprot:CAMPEP_0118640672 /NCGR_PEP_ID=MMETSP0785-20121206/4877_1 /TAXON_ID=91992 /ORGANISM="Bolidomonas pacifica, Strain CCMP 1866" /LENGTH=162 /DNA_ID=CAMNT_0006532073 /DNA_START=167 /DNA_END=655 /DNA_ORIENTATION=+
MDKVDQYVGKVDAFIAKYPSLFMYDQLSNLETKFGYSKVYFFFLTLFTLSTILFLLGGAKLVSDLVGFVYPAYASFKAVDSADPNDDTQWLTYWVVFAVFSIVESAASILVSWIPFYFFLKLAFLIWLYHPTTLGAVVVYTSVIRPYVLPYMGKEDTEKKTD